MRPSTLVGFALAGAKDTGNPNSEIISDAQSHVHVGGLTTLSAVFCMALVERKTLKEFLDALHKLPLVARRRIKSAARSINAILLSIVLYFPCGGNY